MRILLVCADARVPERIAAAARRLRAELITAPTVAEAVRRREEGRVHLVVDAVGSPELRGVLGGTGPGRIPCLRWVPGGPVDAAHALEAGADDVSGPDEAVVLLAARLQALVRRACTVDPLAAARSGPAPTAPPRVDLTELVVHDLKAPTTGAALNVELALALLGPTPGPAGAALQDALLALHRIRGLTEEILVGARLEDGRMVPSSAEVELLPLVTEVLRTLARTARRADVVPRVEVRPDLLVTADPLLLRRVVENLVDNALRHVEPGGRVLIGAEVDAGGLVLVIANTGTPVPAEHRARIFEKYARAAGAVPRGTHLGLGLHFCHRVATTHGGTLHVEETEDWPVRFVLRLPRA